MRVHHLNCATMEPFGGRFVNGAAGPLSTGRIVAHCLLIEAPDGLVLVDTGFGQDVIDNPVARLGRPALLMLRPKLDPLETAARQITALGYSVADVRHIVVTHMDFDHVGGLSDFPHAKVHVHADELAAARNPLTVLERQRYANIHWPHQPDWVEHQTGGERWFGFQSVRELPGLPPEVLMIPLAGHTRGHVGVAVDTGAGWLLRAGDTYYYRGQMDPDRSRCTPILRLFQTLAQANKTSRLHNVQRLRELAAGGEVTVFCAHDPDDLAKAAAS